MDTLVELDARAISVINALLQQRLARNRWHAQQMIEERRVFFGKYCISNIGEMVSEVVPLRIAASPERRETVRCSNLSYAMQKFRFSARGRIAVDLGMTEGECTKILLENGIRRVFAINVEGEPDSSLAEDSRVSILQGVNLRHLHRGFLPFPLSAIIVDSKVARVGELLQHIQRFASPSCWLLAFIYPEVEYPDEVYLSLKDKQVDRALMRRISMEVKQHIEGLGSWRVLGALPSPYIAAEQSVRSIVLAAEHLTI